MEKLSPEACALNMPPSLRAFDAALGLWNRWFQPGGRVSVEKLVSAARRQAGLSDFGTPDFLADLQLFHETFQEAPLTNVGRRGLHDMIRLGLVRRLRLQHELQRDPGIRAEPIRAPFVIIGFPRCGTTLLHNLLRLAPGCRWLRAWEIEPPFPGAGAWGTREDPRLREYQRHVEISRRRNAGIDKLHAVDSPAECWRLLWPSFHCHTIFLFFGFDAYHRWVKAFGGDASCRAYQFHRLQLQFLQHRAAGSGWVLKAPEHTVELPALFATYPDARVIHLHREPRQVVASMCGLAAAVQPACVPGLSGRLLGRQVTGVLAAWVERILSTRAGLPQTRVCDVAYAELVSRPIQTVHAIYRFFETEVSPEYSARLANWQESQAAHPHRGAVHDFERFALNPNEIDEIFKPYRDRFVTPSVRAIDVSSRSA
jgi:hypothetical protein